MTPRARETGQEIFVARQFHLQNRFPSLRTLGKNIKNNLLTVHDIRPRQTLQIALLGGTQLRIKYNQFRAGLFRRIADFFRLAGTQIKLYIRNTDHRHHFPDDGKSQSRNQLAELVKMFTGILREFSLLRHADQKRSGLRFLFRSGFRLGKFIHFFRCKVLRHVFSM